MSGESSIHRNVEIKAKIKNYQKLLSAAQELCQSHGEEIKQEDIFFNVPNGRLKLRKREDYSVSELIFYDRSDVQGPKLSKYSRCKIQNGVDLVSVLGLAMGVKGMVKKTRHLFIIDHTRIHIDDVEDLGKFVELEVCLTKDMTVADGEKIAESVMDTLGIEKADLVDGAYIDLLKKPLIASSPQL